MLKCFSCFPQIVSWFWINIRSLITLKFIFVHCESHTIADCNEVWQLCSPTNLLLPQLRNCFRQSLLIFTKFETSPGQYTCHLDISIK
jgi:hypothetical protein